MAISSVAAYSPIAVLNEHGDIVGVNEAWEAFGDRNGLSEEYTCLDKNYVDISRQAGDQYGDRVAAELRDLLTDEQTEFTVAYPCHSPTRERWFRLYATGVSIGDEQYYVLVHQRLNRDSPPGSRSSSEGRDAPARCGDHRDRSRLITHSLSSDESPVVGLLMAFDALGIDLQSQDTTLQDWIDPDVINTLQSSTSDFYITFPVFNYSVGLTPETVIIYTPEHRSDPD